MRTGRGVSRSGVMAFAALGMSVLALAVPAVWTSRARMAALSLAAPVLRAAAPSGASEDRAPLGAAEELARLRRELVRLDDERRRLQEELDRALEFRESVSRARLDLGRFIEALVVGHAVNWQERAFFIDRGSEDGVLVRSGCVVGGAVAGVVVEVGPRISRVAMLTQNGVKVAVRTLETRRSALAVGTGDGCELSYVARWAGALQRPRVGESVVTAERMGFFPAGFLVGHVAMVGEAPESLHLSIAVQPAVEEPPEGRVWVLRPALRELRAEDREDTGRTETAQGER